MDEELLEMIEEDFPEQNREEAKKQLERITLRHVMDESEFNLANARRAVLHLAKGNMADLVHYVECAMADFRDVIYWAYTTKEDDL
jgi:hypothetical protein